MKNTFLKIVLALFLAISTSFTTENYDDDWERKAVPKKFLNKDCKKLAKKIWNEYMYIYYSATILDVWKDYVLKLFVPPEPELKDIERMKNIRYKTYDANNFSYDFDFKWINNKTLLVQLFDPKSEHNPENSCELWLFEEKDDKVNAYHFMSWNLPD
ncbi:hypothetical protein [Campylobacter concisus]|uniref:hypothetical protein n=1 Tax=Campylobacter concisus TaxID=199 RepID=UPI0011E655EA|nr:hypothetical protein [Campylobacter concisus]